LEALLTKVTSVGVVVMRIPAYNGDFEEPWYWGAYGYDLYQYSYFSDRYRTSHDQADIDKGKIMTHV
jgi:hypothetical protein